MFTVMPDDNQRRLDRVLRKAFPELPLGAISRLLRKKTVLINGNHAQGNVRVHTGDILTLPSPMKSSPMKKTRQYTRPVSVKNNTIFIQKQAAPIIFRNQHYLVVNKPSGLSVHHPRGMTESIQSAAYKEKWCQKSLSFRPGPVHRLDRMTSGVQVFALSAAGAQYLSLQLRNKHVLKVYLALVHGAVRKHMQLNWSIQYNTAKHCSTVMPSQAAGKNIHAAQTSVYPVMINSNEKYSLLAVVPHTGKKHQIRCHMKTAGYPLVDDPLYGEQQPSPHRLYEKLRHSSYRFFSSCVIVVYRSSSRRLFTRCRQ